MRMDFLVFDLTTFLIKVYNLDKKMCDFLFFPIISKEKSEKK